MVSRSICILALLVGFVVAPMSLPDAQAQNTVQDFTATFFPDPNAPDPGGDAPPFKPDACGSGEIGEVMADGWDGQFFRVVHEVGSQLNGIGFNQAHTGDWGSGMTVQFEFRISPGNNGGADGLAFAYLNSGIFGEDTLDEAQVCFSEEPNIPGSFAVGFDIWDNGAQDDNGQTSVSLHFDGARVANVVIDDPLLFDLTTFETDIPMAVTIDVIPVGDGTGSEVTIEIDDGVNIITPYADTLVPGLEPYDGRIGFAARTGGANANHDIDNIGLSIDGASVLEEDFEAFEIPEPPPAEPFRFDQFGSDPAPGVQPEGDGSDPPNNGWDGNFGRLTSEANSQVAALSFNQVHTGDYAELVFEYDFRISPGNGNPNGADGHSFVYLNSAEWGEDTSAAAPNWNPMEEGNRLGSFGVGFDTWESGGEGQNSVSLHYDGALVTSVTLDGNPDIPTFETGTVFHATITVLAGDPDSAVTVVLQDVETDVEVVVFEEEPIVNFSPYDGRAAIGARTGGANQNQDFDNILLTIDEVEVLSETFEDFMFPDPDPMQPPAEPSGGTPFTLVQFGGDPGPEVIPVNGDPVDAPREDEGFLRVAHEVGGNIGLCAFDQTSTDVGEIVASFKLRGLDSGLLGRADGTGFMLFDVDTYGATGGDLIGNFNPMEEPNLAGALGVGFDTFNNNGGGDGVDSPEPNIGNHISVHWDGVRYGVKRFDRLTEIDLVNGEFNEVTVEVASVGADSLVSVSIIDGTDGSEHSVFDDLVVPGMQFGASGARVGFVARTGGAADNYDVDDVDVSFDAGTRVVTVRRSFDPQNYSDSTTPVDVTLGADDLNDLDAEFDLVVRDTLPDGWSASGISDGGTVSDGVITWSFTAVSSDFDVFYTATPPDDNDRSTAVFAGDYSAAGTDRPIGGESDVAYVPKPFGRGDPVTLVDDDFETYAEGECPTGFNCNTNGGFIPGTQTPADFAPGASVDGRLNLIQDDINTTASSVLLTEAIDLTANSVTIEFTARAANPSLNAPPEPADGITFAFLDASIHDALALGASGGGMGYQNLSGFAIELDFWQNGGEPSGNSSGNNFQPPHVALIRDGQTLPHVQTNADFAPGVLLGDYVDSFGIANAPALDFRIEYNNGHVEVYLSAPDVFPGQLLEDEQLIGTVITFPTARKGPVAADPVLQSTIVGLTGGTGGANMTVDIDDLVITTYPAEGGPQPGPIFRRGDTDGNGLIEVTDPINNLTFQFLGTVPPVGYLPPCLDAADFDDNGRLEITDPINNLFHQFLSGDPPPAPGKTTCGVDPTVDDANLVLPPGEPDDELGCLAYPNPDLDPAQVLDCDGN